MTDRTRIPATVLLVSALLSAAAVVFAQQAGPAPEGPAAVAEAAPPATPAEVPPATANDPVADTATPTPEPATEAAPAEGDAIPSESEMAGDAESAAEVEPESQPESDAAASEELVEDEAAGVDWGGLVERAPAFFSVTHPAVVHLPIALWLVGALFVLIGLVIPSWSRQVPLACLWVGALSSIPSTLTGWWNADENGYEGWREFDWESVTVQHRWLAVALTVVSLVLCVLTLVASAKQSRFWGFVWRTGLIGLAIGVGYAGHLGGEIAKGEGFLEEAFEAWVNPEE